MSEDKKPISVKVDVQTIFGEANVTPERVQVLASVAAERQRQTELGYTPEHDDEYGVEHLAIEADRRLKFNPAHFTDVQARARLLRAAALCVAAIEVIDRRQSDETSATRVDLNDVAARAAVRKH